MVLHYVWPWEGCVNLTAVPCQRSNPPLRVRRSVPRAVAQCICHLPVDAGEPPNSWRFSVCIEQPLWKTSGLRGGQVIVLLSKTLQSVYFFVFHVIVMVLLDFHIPMEMKLGCAQKHCRSFCILSSALFIYTSWSRKWEACTPRILTGDH